MDYLIRLANQLTPHIRALRKQAGLTQAQLGAKLGVGQARIAEIEGDPGVVSVDQLLRLLAALDAALVLRDGAGDPVSAAVAAETPAATPVATALAAPPPADYIATPIVIAPNKGEW